MKKIAFLLIFICVLCLFLVSCESMTLATPQNLQIEDGVLSWDKVENASGYLVLLNEEEYRVSTSFIELTLQKNTDYEIKVKALGNGKIKDSAFSETLSYSNKVSSALTRLTAPTILEIDGLGNVLWTLVTNSFGYKIFTNNVLFATIDDPYKTSFNLNLTEVGTYSIQVQAVGDNVSYSDSAKSNVFKFVINSDGKPNIPALSAPEITYNAKTESLEWRSVRNAKEYYVFLNGVAVGNVEQSGKSEYSFPINPNLTTNVFHVVAFGDGVTFGSSKMSNSISFPLQPTDPPQNLRVEVVDGEPLIVFDEVEYSRGYILEINQRQEKIWTTTFNLNLYEDGEYLIRVLADGDNLFYTRTAFSEQISVVVEGGKIQNPMLPSPKLPKYSNGVLSWEEVVWADGYEILVETPFDDTIESFFLTSNETSLKIGEEFEKTIMIFYVRAFGRGYLASLFSEAIAFIPKGEVRLQDESGEIHLVNGEDYSFAKAPLDLTYDGRILSWSRIEEASGYLINVGERQYFSASNTLEIELSGQVVVSVQTLTEKENCFDSPKSAESLIVCPKRLETPTLTLNKTILSWENILGANEYIIFADEEEIHVSGNFIDLKTVLRIDGTYKLSVMAISGDPSIYRNSTRSEEIFFTVDYGEFGTIEKPFLIRSYEDFALMTENPDAYFKIDVEELDLNNATITPLFEESLFSGNLNGNGAIIKNFRISSTDFASGFFGGLGGATIYNLTFENVTLTNGVNVGIISHDAMDVTLENVTLRNAIILISKNADIVGGMFGSFKGSASNIEVNVKIIKSDIDYSSATLNYVGGFAGIAEGEFEGITLSGIIDSPQNKNTYVGFFAGELRGSVNGLSGSNLEITSGGDFNGLISGFAEGDFSNVNVGGKLISNGSFSGLFGYFVEGTFKGKAKIELSVFGVGTVRVGGFAGYVSNAKIDCDLECVLDVTGKTVYVGGLVGYVWGNIDFHFENEIDITVNTNSGFVGGIFGYHSSNETRRVSGRIEVNVDESEKASILIGSFNGNNPDNCLESDVILTGNILAFLGFSENSSEAENEEKDGKI